MTATSLLTSSPFRDESDLHSMQQMLMQARAQCGDDWRYPHVGDLNFSYFMIAIHLQPQRHIRLWHASEQLIGYAILGEDPAFDCQFLSGYAWQGLEDEALDWAQARVLELRQENAETWGGACVCGARQDDSQRMRFLERRGFRQGGEFSEVNLLRSLDQPIPSLPLPPGVVVRSVGYALDGVQSPDAARSVSTVVRPISPAEIANRAGAQREVWHPWTVGEVSDENYALMMHLPGYLRELDVVTVAPDGVIASYVNGWIDPLNRIGDFGPVGTRPPYRRQGLARLAQLECLRRMQKLGIQRVSVSTGVTNAAAIGLYESVGFRIVNRYNEYLKNI